MIAVRTVRSENVILLAPEWEPELVEPELEPEPEPEPEEQDRDATPKPKKTRGKRDARDENAGGDDVPKSKRKRRDGILREGMFTLLGRYSLFD